MNFLISAPEPAVKLQWEHTGNNDWLFHNALLSAQESNKKTYTFAKPVFKHIKKAEVFNWSVISKKIFFTDSNDPNHIELQPGFLKLIFAVKKLVDIKDRLIEPNMRIKLNKLMINIAKTKNWPFNTTIEDVTKVFSNFLNLLETDELLPEHTSKFTSFVPVLNKVLREQSISFEEVAEKIETKIARISQKGPKFHRRLKELFQLVFKKIGSSRSINLCAAKLFCTSFVSLAYIYNTFADDKKGLKTSVQQLVESLSAYDQTHNTWLLRDSFSELLKDFIHTQSAKLALLEALVVNCDFINYMQISGCMNDETKNAVFKLLNHDRTWGTAADFIVFLGSKPIFRTFLDKSMVLLHLNLSPMRIKRIFNSLNKKMHDDKLNKEIYMAFLLKLRYMNKLHFLKSFTSDEAIIIQENLEKLNINYMLPLSSFFENAPFILLNESDNIPDIRFKRILFGLLSQLGHRSVEDLTSFNNELQNLFKEFEIGFKDLFELIMGKLIPQSDNQPLENLLPIAVKHYQTLRAFVLRCFPWKKELSVLEQLPRHCLCENTLCLIEHDEGKFVVKDFTTNKIIDEIKDVTKDVIKDCFLIGDIDGVKSALDELLKVDANRDAVLTLTAAYLANLSRNQSDLLIKLKNYNKPLFIDKITYLTVFFNTGELT